MKQFHAHPELWPDQVPENKKLIDSMASVELSDQQHAQIKEIFDLFDTDGDGSIDCREKDAALYALGFQPTFGSKLQSSIRRQQDNMLLRKNSVSQCTTSEEDFSQAVSLQEFTQMMKGEQVVRNPLDAIWGAFAELSCGAESHMSNASGQVTLEGLRRACSKYDVKLNDAELSQMIADTDIDGDGSVDKDEFLHIMNQAPWF
jgi:centrin-3